MNIEIPPFYVGQEIVAIKDHSVKVFKKGEEYVVTGIEKGCCVWLITIGISSDKSVYSCKRCGGRFFKSNSECRFNAACFSPKIEIKEFISLAKLAEKTLETVGAN